MYSSDLYQKALNRLDRRREEDELRTAATLAEVSAKVPRLEEIQNQLRQVGFSISKAFFAKLITTRRNKWQSVMTVTFCASWATFNTRCLATSCAEYV
jgi:hypothetical protein